MDDTVTMKDIETTQHKRCHCPVVENTIKNPSCSCYKTTFLLNFRMADQKRSTTYKGLVNEIESCGTTTAKDISRIFDICRLQPRNETIVDAYATRYYGEEAKDTPKLRDTRKSPFGRLHTVSELCKILKDSMEEFEYVETTPSSGSHEKDKKAALELIDNLDDPSYGRQIAILGLECSQLHQDMKTSSAKLPGTVHEEEILVCDVTPCGDIRALDFNEGHEINILNHGKKIWFVYAPTEHNLKAISRPSDSGTADNSALDFVTLQMMEGGMFFVQNAGETVRIPPFCPGFVFSLETSTCSYWQVLTAPKIPLRLKNIAFSSTQLAKRSEAAQQNDRPEFAEELLSSIEIAFRNDLEDYNCDAIVTEIIDMWGNIEDELHAQARISNSKDWGEKIGDLWAKHTLMDNKKSNQKCSLCDRDWKWYNKSYSMLEDTLRDHFLKEHWAATPTSTPSSSSRKRKRNVDTHAMTEDAHTPTRKRVRVSR